MWCALRPARRGEMQRDQPVHGQRAEELLEQLGVHRADLVAREVHVPGEERPAGEIDRGLGQRLVHRHQRLAEPPDAALLAERAGQRLAEHDADILGGVVEIDMRSPVAFTARSNSAVAGERGQHVVEEADAGRDLGAAGSVEIERQLDRGLGGRAVDRRGAGHGRRTSSRLRTRKATRRPMRAACQCEISSSCRLRVRGPKPAIEMMTISIETAMKMNTAGTPPVFSSQPITKLTKTVLIRLNE